MEIDLRNLEETLILFYRSDPTQQATAHEWLTQAQSSPQAWHFAWELMQPGKPSEIQFFGATTLHSKIMKHWNEIPKEFRPELKQKLFEKIITFGNGPKIVLDRLCITLSAFIVHMILEWPTIVDDVINVFKHQQLSNLSPNTQMWILMDVLCGIPEEMSVIFISVARVQVRNEIHKNTNLVVNTINQYISLKCDVKLENDDMSTVLQAVKCAAAWFKNGVIPLDNCQFIVESLLKLVNNCYWNSTESDGCMSAEANELSDMCLETLSGIMVQPDAHRYPNSALSFMRMFLHSLSNITKNEWKENNLNEDIAVAIYHLFISSIECHSRLLVAGLATENSEHKEFYVQLIQQVLECSDKPGIYPVEESCSTLAMGFWYMLQDEIISMPNSEQKEIYIASIKPLYSYLTKILVKKSQQPNELALERWSCDDLESFRCYRQDISDTLIYCYEVLNDDILNIFFSILQQSITSVQKDINDWPKLEACLFAFSAVAEHVPGCENFVIPKFITILNELPYKKLNENVLGMSLECIGAYSEWFKENPEYLQNPIQLLVEGLSSPKAAQATLGLKYITKECQNEMKEFAEPLLNACQQLLVGGQLKSAESIRVMYSVGKLMSLLPPEKITICLDSIVSPFFKEMYFIVESPNRNEISKTRIKFCLTMISSLFTTLNIKNDEVYPNSNTLTEYQTQPVLVIMQKTMPILKSISDLYINDEQVLEALCNVLKYAILNLSEDFAPMLPDVTQLILNIWKSKYCAPVLEITKLCVVDFFNFEQFKSIIKEFIYGITTSFFILFERTAETNLSDIADLIESFYILNSNIVKKRPRVYAESNIDCAKLVCYGLKSIMLPEYGPIKHGTQFLSHFILQSRNHENMQITLLENGEFIVRTIILCIGEVSPRTQVECFADIFLSLNKVCPSEIGTWLKVLEIPNFPTTRLTTEDKSQFMKAMIREKVNKRLIQALIRDFAIKSRGLAEQQK